jgi:hypothetical protein
MAGRHLQKLRAEKFQKRAGEELTKPTKRSPAVEPESPTAGGGGFGSFVSAQGRGVPDFFGSCSRALSALEARCPDLVPPDRWQDAVDDGRAFLAKWGEQAEALGWTARDLFGLHTPPEKPHPSYSRLSRYDETGLIWLLQGRPVVALTGATAAIQNPSGAITTYRKYNKPALGLVGDSLDDL